ncbi:unnamed protein product [Paramecium primaurelia]|uniref:ATP-dependent DNA helicase n=1 Tax=Paramecium primaurelia TaxID=5886 RepID=A0A8S1Q628_PARPR|nr:unnamed protein product [Paramecium primaurelia]
MEYNDFQRLLSEEDELVQISRAQLEQLILKNQLPETLPVQKKSCKKIVIQQAAKKQKPYQFADVHYWTITQFDWDTKVLEALKGAFGKEQFKANQKAIINCVLAGKDVFVCMPTGYGKSITFQIPAFVENGVSIVVMPLISLIFDQVQYLTSLGIPSLNMSGQNRLLTAQQILDQKIKLIYTTPEKIEKSEQFKQILGDLFNRKLIKRFVIDEAHCVSKWGRDFRPDYLKLSNVRNEYPNIPIIALTATAPEEVKEDIIDVLQIKGCLYLQSSFNRPNLVYEVRCREEFKKAVQEIKEFINQTYPKQSGIIYCLTQSECQTLSQNLIYHGIGSDFYHAGLTEKERHRIHKNWLMNEVQVIVATVAFGMGIDKKDCRFVIHFQMPKSIENYYQESGRAGRDGKQAHCLLFYNNNDYKTNLYLMDQNTEMTAQMKKYNIKKLDQMQQFCYDRVSCRRVLQLSYLGENFDRTLCNKKCDNCQRDDENAEKINLTTEALKILDCLDKYPLTENQLIQCLKGAQDKKKSNNSQKNVEQIFGLFKHNPRNINPLLDQLRAQNALSQKVQCYNVKGNFKNKVVYLTPNSGTSLKSVIISIPREKDKRSSVLDQKTNDLFKKYLSKENNNQNNNGINLQINQNVLQKDFIWQNGTNIETEQKKLQYDNQYGYCLENQFNDLRERLMLVRKNIYKEMTNDASNQIINIDLVLSTDDIEELCKKLPTTMSELNDPFICIAQEIKKLQYMKHFIEEVAHFVDIEEINKLLFEKPKQTETQIDQVFEFQKHIRQEDDVVDITNQEFIAKQKEIEELLVNGQEHDDYLDELLNLIEEDEKKKSPDIVIIDDDFIQNDFSLNKKPQIQQVSNFEAIQQQNQISQDLKQTDKIENNQQSKKLKINLKRSFL